MTRNLDERIEYRRIPEMPGVEVLRADHAMRCWRVFHETYAVCALLDLSGGEAEWTYRGKLHSTKAGMLMLLEPGEVHANTKPPPPCNFRVLFIAPALVEKAAKEVGMAISRPHLKFAHLSDQNLFQAFVRFHAALEGAASRLERESRLAGCMRLLLQQCTETGSPAFRQPARSALVRARELIREHYWRPIRLDELAAAAGLSRYHLVRAFSKEFGLPPHAYQTRVQVEKARVLLAQGLAPALVAAQTGFADQSHFTRHFKRINGVTPGEYVRGTAAGARRRIGLFDGPAWQRA